MPAIDLLTTGQADIDPAKLKALLTASLLLTTNTYVLRTDTILAKSDADVQAAKAAGASNNGTTLVYYLDMRDVYAQLKPLTPDQINGFFSMARQSSYFRDVAQQYWQQGNMVLGYERDHVCLPANSVLAMNS